MFNLFKKKPAPVPVPESKPKTYKWPTEQARLWKTLVPAKGQAETLQGELIRIAGKLTDEAFRNGNMNWDDEMARMWRFVGRHLDDPATFTEAERTLICTKIDEIIRNYDSPDLSGPGCCYYLITEKVVDWCMAHPDPIPHQKDDKLKR